MKPNFNKITTQPGIYFFLNKNGDIIYIGKAKNIFKRVKSYWQKGSELTEQKQQMVSEISKVQFTVVDNETESLLLEASQIKKYQPKYNIVLKDDKNWGYIVILDEPFPRIVVTHGRQRRKGQHFGPYTSTLSARTTVRFLHRVLPLRTCNRNLSHLPKGKICLEYHMHRCPGPCEKLINNNDYKKIIDSAKKILRGQTKDIEKNLRTQISTASKNKNFELANIKKKQLAALQRIKLKQKIISQVNINQDIINLSSIGQKTILTLMTVRKGILGDKFNFTIDNKLSLPDKEIFQNFINQFYTHKADLPKNIILPTKINKNQTLLEKNIKIILPQRGKNKDLLALVKKNADLVADRMSINPNIKKLLSLQKLLKLSGFPKRIEVYDISNISGEHAVGSMVVFNNGQIDSDQYRLFKIKGIPGPNDAHMMAQVLSRRSKHSEWTTPDLIILDGGKPQLNTVMPVLPKNWKNKIIALAKKEEEIFLPGIKKSLKLTKSNPISLMLQNMRNQAHKFAIKNYRKQHQKNWL
ncbi:excinuclease ABC subunit UvrC [Candidatus Parcubacteria bacterium]|nr:excinuclease ABC subunit UvrC [Candidatus Parcubacteria bacterium]MBT7228011.1 excinuclease ABC subunit UvrC [Candidatus Parcubacteria bacterium]